MRLALARVLTLWVAATLALLLQPVRASRANEAHAGLERTQNIEVAADSPRRSTISERGLERRGDAADADDFGWLDERPTLARSGSAARVGMLTRRTGPTDAPRPAASARGPPPR